jgi:hypothetical protein
MRSTSSSFFSRKLSYSQSAARIIVVESLHVGERINSALLESNSLRDFYEMKNAARPCAINLQKLPPVQVRVASFTRLAWFINASATVILSQSEIDPLNQKERHWVVVDIKFPRLDTYLDKPKVGDWLTHHAETIFSDGTSLSFVMEREPTDILSSLYGRALLL